jgi:hypothetical protein
MPAGRQKRGKLALLACSAGKLPPGQQNAEKGAILMEKPQYEKCMECAYAKNRFGGSCYCVKFGYVIGYAKTECRGFEREQVQEQKNDG